nr:potassium channel family protein [Marinobacter daqiaonensis]
MLTATVINSLIVVLAVLFHYECLMRLSTSLGHMRPIRQLRLLVAVLGILIAHTVEVWLFAGAYYLMHHADGWGQLTVSYSGSFMDTVYFSFVTFTTLGYGDIEPVGILRYLTGIQGLTGFVLITWSASFLFVEMQRYWPSR